jgi:cbb3-type cytochrome oxidase subunit 3
MQVILGIIVFGLIAIAIIVMIVINFMYRNVKRLREDAEDFLYRRGKRNEQKERNPFGEDYFKSSRKPGSQGAKSRGSRSSSSDSESTERKTARRTTTSGGVTIIDERPEDKKIFDKADDEYVEFEEVNS